MATTGERDRSEAPAPTIGALRARLDDVMLVDRARFEARLGGARKVRGQDRRRQTIARVSAEIEKSAATAERRAAACPTIDYPDLPVSARKDEIAAAIRDHQVVIVAGETGSGKTTQIPKICLELGRGVRGMIGHTQPRRLAARTVAERIAEELRVDLGEQIGYAVRFTDQVGRDTLVKLMTDGILLTDINRDRQLTAYDTIIIDEAHERSLNIDFILGYLRELLPQRPDLKIIVTSATIDPERFADHFGGAPIIEVSGRTYPVEMRYRPLESDGDQVQGIIDAVDELAAEPPGDVLVFLSGEREIRDTAEALRGNNWRDTEILPLYARLAAAEQHKVFAPHRGRRIVLATNVAETSLTVPGIRYVVDPGMARISRYSHRLKVQRLPIEPVSQASANQRAGRCGRVADGVCIRLYEEEDFEARPEFTEPEILRTNLASVILQMKALDLGEVADFPFVDPPDRRAVVDGMRLLEEVGAIDVEDASLTAVGRTLSRLPVDPRFGRMVIEANRRECLREVLIIVSGLSIQDPRERPADEAAHADQMHARFRVPGSDFLGYLALWRYLREQQRALSGNQFRRMCKREHLNFLRVREWQDVHSQLRQIAGEQGMKQGGSGARAAGSGQFAAWGEDFAEVGDDVHRALLAGLLSHLGLRDDRDAAGKSPRQREYRGARNARFALFPGSGLAKKPPAWVMAAELVETSRLWARDVAAIRPEWVEPLAGHLVRHSYSEPHWSTERGSAMAYESISLYGLPLVTRRLVGYGSIDREHARELFIRHALVEGEWATHHVFLGHNRELLTELAELEHRFRRSDLVADEDALYRLYDARLPADVESTRRFDSWWKKTRRNEPDLLTFTVDDVLADVAEHLDEGAFPEWWRQGELELPLTYTYQSGAADDGVTVHIPLGQLNQIDATPFEWQVPGLRAERVAALIRTLPKHLRRNLVPVGEHVGPLLGRLTDLDEPLLPALSRELARPAGAPIPLSAWDPSSVPAHLRMGFAIQDEAGEVLAFGKDLDALRAEVAPRLRREIAAATRGIEQRGLTAWSFGELPRRIEQDRNGGTVVGYPALVDEGSSVAIRVFDNEVDRDEAHWAGVRRLLALTVPLSSRDVRDRIERPAGLAMTANPCATVADLVDDVITASFDNVMIDFGRPVDDAVAFDSLVDLAASAVREIAFAAAGHVAAILRAASEIDARLDRDYPVNQIGALEDVAGQRAELVRDGFVVDAGTERLADVDRYLRAAVVRLDALPKQVTRDRERMAVVHRVERAYSAVVEAAGAGPDALAELERIGWLIEELRVSLFAQPLGTPEPVSEPRIMKALQAIPV